MKRGLFIVVDGLGGTGKTTQLDLLKKHLPPDAVFTQEPGGAPRSTKIRTILKEGDGKAEDPLTDFFLFWAARAEHVAARVRPALAEGKIVVSDRFDSSTFAMQIYGEGRLELLDFFMECRRVTLPGADPDCYIILDADLATSHVRRDQRAEDKDRFDARDDTFQDRVRHGYKEFVKRFGERAHLIDANRRPEEVDAEIWGIIQPLIR